ncbi:MAG: ABC transporter permease [Anaerolineaceae bacterium]|nr:ABC transporter permease [Anaerolineaceae bacterium]
MSDLFRGLIRASSFLRKEIFEVIRQPRLVATLILGPFLILFIFGIGYNNQPHILRTLFVVQSNSAITAQEIQQSQKSLSNVFIYAGVTSSQSDALKRLREGQIDLVIIEPQDAMTTIQNNQQAVFTIYYNEIDPTQVSYINYLGWLYASTVNQQVLQSLAVQGQKNAVGLHNQLQEAHQNIESMRQALQNNNAALAPQKLQELAGNINSISVAFGATQGLLNGLQQSKGTNGTNSNSTQSTLSDLLQNTKQLSDNTSSKDKRLASLDKMDQEISSLDNNLSEFQSVDPAIIVNPFSSETKSVASVQPSSSEFFAPAVLALLLQHLAVMFAALSIVREWNVGTMELFRVSPLSAAETLFGKYLSYMLFGGVIAAILSGLLAYILHVPMLGNWWYYALVMAAILFTSLGFGFIISIISQSDSQAVQYSMIILLASVFFSGFILNLDMLLPQVKIISYLLPTTYGTLLLRDIALRGIGPNWLLLGGLIGIGFVLMVISWLLMRRLIASPQ